MEMKGVEPDDYVWELLKQVGDRFLGYTHIPVCLGSGFSGLAHEVGGMLQSFALEQHGSLDNLHEYLHSFVSFTTDMGTEFGIANFRYSGSVGSLLPCWMILTPALTIDAEYVSGPQCPFQRWKRTSAAL